MKKFLLIFLLAFTAQFVMAQTSAICIDPSKIKRNNGNSCKSISNPLGGKVTIDFGVLPAANFQLFDVIAGPTSSTVVPSTKEVKAQNASITWCFEVDNMGSFATANYTFRYYYDQNVLGVYDGETIYVNCSSFSLNGSISCGTAVNTQQINYSLDLQSNYDDAATAGVDVVSGTYKLYADTNRNEVFDAQDVLVKNPTSFTTSTAVVKPGFNSAFVTSQQLFDRDLPKSNSAYKVLIIATITSTPIVEGVSTTAINPCGALPVSLVSFNAAQRSGKAVLSWATATESNNDGFEVERRIGNGQYQKIAFVDSKAPGGNGAAYTYSFEDPAQLSAGVTYYRLKQIDFDGGAAYSEIKAVRTANGTLMLSVYPNPSRGNATVVIPDGMGNVNVSVEDFAGRSVQHFNNISAKNVQLTNLKPGLYVVRVFVAATGETKAERLTVQ